MKCLSISVKNVSVVKKTWAWNPRPSSDKSLKIQGHLVGWCNPSWKCKGLWDGSYAPTSSELQILHLQLQIQQVFRNQKEQNLFICIPFLFICVSLRWGWSWGWKWGWGPKEVEACELVSTVHWTEGSWLIHPIHVTPWSDWFIFLLLTFWTHNLTPNLASIF